MSVSASAPGKLVLFGDHAAVYGYPCIVTAVDLRYTVSLEIVDTPGISIDTAELRTGNEHYHVAIDQLSAHNRRETAFVEAALVHLQAQHQLKSGLLIRTEGPPQSYGLGSSSAITAATIGAYAALFELELTPHQLFDLAYAAVLDVQGTGSGVDLAAAIYGGTVYYVKGGSVMTPLTLGHLPIVIGYSGKKVGTTNLIAQVAALRHRQPHLIDPLLALMGNIATQAQDRIIAGDWTTLGDLTSIHQGLLASLGVSTPKLDKLIHAAREAGAYGAKLSGAGGGDCMFALASPEHSGQIAAAITAAGGQALHFQPNAQGLNIESNAGA